MKKAKEINCKAISLNTFDLNKQTNSETDARKVGLGDNIFLVTKVCEEIDDTGQAKNVDYIKKMMII